MSTWRFIESGRLKISVEATSESVTIGVREEQGKWLWLPAEDAIALGAAIIESVVTELEEDRKAESGDWANLRVVK